MPTWFNQEKCKQQFTCTKTGHTDDSLKTRHTDDTVSKPDTQMIQFQNRHTDDSLIVTHKGDTD